MRHQNTAISDDMHAFPASFGLKGEAMSSSSGVSLLEIVTKTHGRPNGYCKVLKVSVCTLELIIVDKMLVKQDWPILLFIEGTVANLWTGSNSVVKCFAPVKCFSGWEDESIVAGRSTEDASFRESLELDDSSNVMHERRKLFIPEHRSLIHDGSSFASDEDIKFEKL